MEQDKEQHIKLLLAAPSTQREGFEILVREYSEQLYWQVRRIVLTHEDANDALQNTFLKAWNNISTFRNDSKISTWLYRIAINESLDCVRKKKARYNFNADIEDSGIANRLLADNYFDFTKTEALLQEAIALLPDVQRSVFNLRYFDNMKYSEISNILGTSEGALKASYHIATKKISEYLHTHD